MTKTFQSFAKKVSYSVTQHSGVNETLKIASFLKEKMSDLQFPHCKSEMEHFCAPHQSQIVFNDDNLSEWTFDIIRDLICNLIEIFAMPKISGNRA